MTKKLIKILVVLTILLGFSISYVFATDINLNLPGTDKNQIEDNVADTDDNQNIENPTGDEQNVQDNITDQNNIDNENSIVDEDESSSIPEQLQPSEISSSSESGLSVTNIINILLITVGVILILLAIVIRLK